MTLKVLLVDGSALERLRLAVDLERFDGIHVVGAVADPFAAREMILRRPPDVLVMETDLPRVDGLTFLAKLMAHRPLPTVIFAHDARPGSETAARAIAYGAVSVLHKGGPDTDRDALLHNLVGRIRNAAAVDVMAQRLRRRARTPRAKVRLRDPGEGRADAPLRPLLHQETPVLAIGASTGGTDALASLLSRMPVNSPPILIVQHIPSEFVPALARRLDAESEVRVRRAANGDRLAQGTALICPGDVHMTIRREGCGFQVALVPGPRVNRHRPSVDVLFDSVASAAGRRALGVLLTGMGRDGAEGLRAMRQAGAHTIVQDRGSSAVFGMPRAAIDRDAAGEVAPLSRIPQKILHAVMSRAV